METNIRTYEVELEIDQKPVTVPLVGAYATLVEHFAADFGLHEAPTSKAGGKVELSGTESELFTAARDGLLPNEWPHMEIEAKWLSTENGQHELLTELRRAADGKGYRGYEVEIEPRNNPRLVADEYWDYQGDVLAAASHSLRCRLRSNRRKGSWRPQFDVIQYKGAPIRFGAVWLRPEIPDHRQGACRSWHRKQRREHRPDLWRKELNFSQGVLAEDLLLGKETVDGPRHPAIERLLLDHPELAGKLHTGCVVRKVRAERTRVNIRKGGKLLFVLSVDKTTSNILV